MRARDRIFLVYRDPLRAPVFPLVQVPDAITNEVVDNVRCRLYHRSVDGTNEEEDDDDVDLNGKDKDLCGAPAPGAIVFPADDAAGMGDNNDEDFIVNYDMLNLVNNEYTLSEKMVHCVGGHVLPENGMACKATLVFHDRATVCQMKPTTKARRHDATLVEYNDSAIDKTHFSPDIICYSRHSSFKGKSMVITALTLQRQVLLGFEKVDEESDPQLQLLVLHGFERVDEESDPPLIQSYQPQDDRVGLR
jgi:hypothetical protein